MSITLPLSHTKILQALVNLHQILCILFSISWRFCDQSCRVWAQIQVCQFLFKWRAFGIHLFIYFFILTECWYAWQKQVCWHLCVAVAWLFCSLSLSRQTQQPSLRQWLRHSWTRTCSPRWMKLADSLFLSLPYESSIPPPKCNQRQWKFGRWREDGSR